MKLAFSGLGRYADFEKGYELYKKRSKTGEYADHKTYNRIVRMFCSKAADRLLETGMVDLPELGLITTAIITRKPQYRGKKFIGYGKMDWSTGHYDGKLKTFGIVFLPDRKATGNLRSFGYVANRQLFKKVKAAYESGRYDWKPLDFSDEII